MNFKSVPTLYLEPRVVMLDDDEDFLDAVGDLLCNVINVESCQNPVELVHRLQQDRVLQRSVEACVEYSDDSSDKTGIIQLNYKNLAQKLYAYHLSNEFISVVCIDYMMPTMNGLDVARALKDLTLSRVLVTANIKTDDLIAAFNEGIITRIIDKARIFPENKSEDEPEIGLEDEIEEVVREQHFKVIQAINADLFGSFAKSSEYTSLFAHIPFIAFYESFLQSNSIVFSCVYEPGGSMIMMCRDGTSYFINIYSEAEIKCSLFPTDAYETQISPLNRKKVERFERIVDYKTNNDQNRLNDLAGLLVTDLFTTYDIQGKKYYVVFRRAEESDVMLFNGLANLKEVSVNDIMC